MDSNILIMTKVISNAYESSKMSKREIAQKTGLSLNTVTNTLSGKNSTTNTLFKMMDCLGLTLEDIVTKAKALGLSFQKPKPVKGKLNNEVVKKLLDGGKTIPEIAKMMGCEEADVKENLQQQMSLPSTSEVKVFQAKA